MRWCRGRLPTWRRCWTSSQWPFSFLFRNFVISPEYHPWWELADMPWVLVCAIVLVVGTLTRNVKVGAGLAAVLAICGLLGNEFWEETVLTIGLVVVSVVICTVIGIPLGVLCGRVDGIWNAVRPGSGRNAGRACLRLHHSLHFLLRSRAGAGHHGHHGVRHTSPDTADEPGNTPGPRRRRGGKPRLRGFGVEGAHGCANPARPSGHHDRTQPDPAALHLDDRHRRHHGRQRAGPAGVPGRHQH